ncbi:MAG: response regulator transcription factor [Firmicutes bacterium]|nr:response regulator transcription factor [Bacillota bacterium]
MRVYICDDDAVMVEELVHRSRYYLEEKLINAEIRGMTVWPEDLLMNQHGENADESKKDQSEIPDIVILDIDMPVHSGIEIKDALEQMEEGPFIIFVTSHREMVYDAFGRNVIGFLPKPVDSYHFRRLMEKAVDFCRSRYLSVPLENGERLVCSKIRYIEAAHIYTSVMLQDGSLSLRRSLTEWERLLPMKDFFRISEKHIVHFAAVDRIDGDKVLLKSGEKLSLSRRRKNDCQKSYLNYCTRKARFQ